MNNGNIFRLMYRACQSAVLLLAFLAVGVAHAAPPVANAGINKTVQEGELVVLDGTRSRDKDRDALTYSWTVENAEQSAHSRAVAKALQEAGANTPVVKFRAPDAVQNYSLNILLTVTANGDSHTDKMHLQVQADNDPLELKVQVLPRTGAIYSGQVGTLRSYLVNPPELGENLRYRWKQWTKPNAQGTEVFEGHPHAFDFKNPSAVTDTLTFTAPNINGYRVLYFRLRAEDVGDGDSYRKYDQADVFATIIIVGYRGRR